jgi:hypothetical protein
MNPKLAQHHSQPLLQLWCKNVVNFESRQRLAAKLTVATKILKPEGEGRESEADSGSGRRLVEGVQCMVRGPAVFIYSITVSIQFKHE